MLGVSDILTMISMGQKVVRTLADLKKDTQSLRPAAPPPPDVHGPRIAAIEKRLDDLETASKEQDQRLNALANALRDTLKVTEALSDRVAVIFWIALAGCVLAAIAAVASLIFLIHGVH